MEEHTFYRVACIARGPLAGPGTTPHARHIVRGAERVAERTARKLLRHAIRETRALFATHAHGDGRVVEGPTRHGEAVVLILPTGEAIMREYVIERLSG